MPLPHQPCLHVNITTTSNIIKNHKKKDSAIVSIIGHGGDTHAFHADLAYIPEQKVGAVVLTNSVNGRSMSEASKLLREAIAFAARSEHAVVLLSLSEIVSKLNQLDSMDELMTHLNEIREGDIPI